MIDTAQEIAQLRALLAEREAELALTRTELTGAKLLIEQYKAQLAKLRRMQFGQSSEKLDAQIDQLELMLAYPVYSAILGVRLPSTAMLRAMRTSPNSIQSLSPSKTRCSRCSRL